MAPSGAGALGGATNAREGALVVHGATGRGIREALFDSSPNINLLCEIIQARPFGELVDESLRVVANVRGVDHTWNLRQKSAGRKCGHRAVSSEFV